MRHAALASALLVIGSLAADVSKASETAFPNDEFIRALNTGQRNIEGRLAQAKSFQPPEQINRESLIKAGGLNGLEFQFNDDSKYKISDQSLNLIVTGIAGVNALFDDLDLPKTISIHEGGCDPAHKVVNGKSTIYLGDCPARPVDSITLAHEHGHAIFAKRIGHETDGIPGRIIGLENTIMMVNNKRSLKQCALSGPSCSLDLEPLLAEVERLKPQVDYILALHEYFADMVAIVRYESPIGCGSGSGSESFLRDYSQQFSMRQWRKDQAERFSDTHYFMQPLWNYSWELAKTSFSSQGAKKDFLKTLLDVFSEDIRNHLNDYRREKVDLISLNQRIREALVPSSSN